MPNPKLWIFKKLSSLAFILIHLYKSIYMLASSYHLKMDTAKGW